MAFLTLQLRQARGWFLRTHSDVLARGQAEWFFNFGFPAASLDEPLLARRYARICAAALMLAEERADVTVRCVTEALMEAASGPFKLLTRFSAALVPEISAAVAGFAYSAKADRGLFALVDVGGSTLDCCTFNLFEHPEKGMICPIFEAEVGMLGVEPCHACDGLADMRAEFRVRLDHLPRGAILRTRTERYQRSPRWDEGLPVFLTGGGAHSQVHADSLRWLDGWLRRNKTAGANVQQLDPIPALSHECRDPDQVQRLLVAIGLSRPFHEIPQPRLPREIEDEINPERTRDEDRYVGSELT